MGALTTPAVANMLSPSQVNDWLDCPARWYYHYALGLPTARTVALAIGDALHNITAACLRIWNRGQNPEREAADYLRIMLDAALADCDTEGEDREDLHATAQRMLTAWFAVVAPALRKIADLIEYRMVGTIAGVTVQGLADVITSDGMVIDLKTAAAAPAGVKQSHRLQITTYVMLAEQHLQRKCTAGRLVTITKAKTPKTIPQTIEITDADRRYAEWAYATAQREMQAGSAIYPRRSSTLCSRGNCAYWQICEDEFGGKVKE